ncbi:MAG TPA: hypothetical protein VEX68_25595 [Bryobacteraceae bacterium]|nr:hypothetical protein [Bryobacteraceae bacterium]
MHGRSKSFARLVSAIIFGSPIVLLADPGFGSLRRKNIDLEVRQPALVRLSDTSIAFTGKVASKEYQAVLESLLSTLETEIVSHEKTLQKKQSPKEAEWTLYLNVTGYAAPQPHKNTQRSGNTTTVTNRWTGSLKVAYQVLDQSGRVHDADNVSDMYDKTYVEGAGKGANSFFGIRVPGAKATAEPIPQTPEDVKQILVHNVVNRIGAKLGNTTLAVPVKIATGEDRLNRAADFMDQRLWSRALEELQATPPFSNVEHESYRLYDLGLVHEAMSYESKSYKDQRANLFQAQEYYDKALETNRNEKYFVETVARLRDSIARYRTLDQQQAQEKKTVTPTTRARNQEAPPTPAPAPVQTPPPAPPAVPTPKANTASDIIKLYQASVPADQIMEIIRSAPLEFNPVDIPTVLAINKAKVPIDIQNEMRKKVGASPLPPPEPAKPKTAPRKATPPKA